MTWCLSQAHDEPCEDPQTCQGCADECDPSNWVDELPTQQD